MAVKERSSSAGGVKEKSFDKQVDKLFSKNETVEVSLSDGTNKVKFEPQEDGRMKTSFTWGGSYDSKYSKSYFLPKDMFNAFYSPANSKQNDRAKKIQEAVQKI